MQALPLSALVPRTVGPLLTGEIRARGTWAGHTFLNRNAKSQLSHANGRLTRAQILHASEAQAPWCHKLDTSLAYRAERNEKKLDWRDDDRQRRAHARRGLSDEPSPRPITTVAKLIVRRGARAFQQKGHIDAASENFRQGRKQIKQTSKRLKEDDFAGQLLYNGRNFVSCSPLHYSPRS